MQTHLIAFFLLCCGLLLFTPLIKIGYRHYKRKVSYTRILKEIDALFANTNPFLISKIARLQNLPHFLYGEIEICTLLDLIALTHPLPQQNFYDLGSGSGKAALAVKMCYPTLNVTGIEIIPALHELALQKYHQFLDKPYFKAPFDVNFIQGDFISVDFKDADIVFINATAYEEATWQQILDKLVMLKAGASVIITSKTLSEQVFCKKYQCMALMSWGLTSTRIYEKRH